MTAERVRFIYRLRPGAGCEYDEHHQQIPEALRRLIDSAGICDYTIWRHEEVVVCEFETTRGYRETSRILAASDIQKEWTSLLWPLFESTESDGEPLWLHEVFRLE